MSQRKPRNALARAAPDRAHPLSGRITPQPTSVPMVLSEYHELKVSLDIAKKQAKPSTEYRGLP